MKTKFTSFYTGVASTPDWTINNENGEIVCSFPPTTTKTASKVREQVRLITAAPELLEALTNLKDEVVKECNIGSDKSLLPMLGYVQDAIRAIKKATE